MSDLEDLQRIAQRHLLEGGPLPGALGTALSPPVEERWGIYCEGYVLRLVASLARNVVPPRRRKDRRTGRRRS